MDDNDEKRSGLIKPLIDKCIKKTKNPLLILLIVALFKYGVNKGIYSLNVISCIACLFFVTCILWRDQIVKCFDKWIEFRKQREEQKTIRNRLTERRKTVKYEYLEKQKEEAKKKQTDSSNQNDDDSSCKMYEIKRRGS